MVEDPVAIVLAADGAGVRPQRRRLLERAGTRDRRGRRRRRLAVEAAARHRPAALVLDLDRPGTSRRSTPSALWNRPPGTRVIVL
jgi:DNA-binding NarL/FixJ family response regulator